MDSGDPDAPELPLTKKMKLIQKHTASSQGNPDARLRKEIKAYILHTLSSSTTTRWRCWGIVPLSFWQQNKSQLLKEPAKDILSRSASLVLVENVFSTLVFMLNGKRSALAPHRANWLSFLRDNFPFYSKSAKDTSD